MPAAEEKQKEKALKQKAYEQETNYAAVKKHLNDKKKRVSVWVDKDKYDLFKDTVHENGDSIYALVNQLIDDYLISHGKTDE